MQYEVFTIPVLGGSEESERMNRFLRGHKVVQVTFRHRGPFELLE